MSEEFESEEAIVEAWESMGDLQKHPLSSDNFAFYSLLGHYGGEVVIGFFKDTKDKWHTLDHGYWIDPRYGNLNTGQINRRIKKLQQKNGHIADNEGRIYFKENGIFEDTGFIDPHAHLLRNAFVNMDYKDPYHDVLNPENITSCKLYKRQEDGSYKQIWKSKYCIFQKEDFPDNVYFSGGSWQYKKIEDYFIDGKVDEATKQKIDIAIKLEELRQRKDPLQERQQRLNEVVGKKKLGKTADTKTGQVTDEHREIAKQQVKISKALIKAKREMKGKSL